MWKDHKDSFHSLQYLPGCKLIIKQLVWSHTEGHASLGTRLRLYAALATPNKYSTNADGDIIIINF